MFLAVFNPLGTLLFYTFGCLSNNDEKSLGRAGLERMGRLLAAFIGVTNPTKPAFLKLHDIGVILQTTPTCTVCLCGIALRQDPAKSFLVSSLASHLSKLWETTIKHELAREKSFVDDYNVHTVSAKTNQYQFEEASARFFNDWQDYFDRYLDWHVGVERQLTAVVQLPDVVSCCILNTRKHEILYHATTPTCPSLLLNTLEASRQIKQQFTSQNSNNAAVQFNYLQFMAIFQPGGLVWDVLWDIVEDHAATSVRSDRVHCYQIVEQQHTNEAFATVFVCNIPSQTSNPENHSGGELSSNANAATTEWSVVLLTCSALSNISTRSANPKMPFFRGASTLSPPPVSSSSKEDPSNSSDNKKKLNKAKSSKSNNLVTTETSPSSETSPSPALHTNLSLTLSSVTATRVKQLLPDVATTFVSLVKTPTSQRGSATRSNVNNVMSSGDSSSQHNRDTADGHASAGPTKTGDSLPPNLIRGDSTQPSGSATGSGASAPTSPTSPIGNPTAVPPKARKLPPLKPLRPAQHSSPPPPPDAANPLSAPKNNQAILQSNPLMPPPPKFEST
eukprot:TRINITY_DN59178_c0_g1_i1.p1 TRINITY_DN59178_c0_g1~~TRINITY_DN59178_c0_g1_i1.p1  ORF type:complete len:562 (+),score=52.56 TRINITY_DN59178_c0_g1_i1:24-1709(+)